MSDIRHLFGSSHLGRILMLALFLAMAVTADAHADANTEGARVAIIVIDRMAFSDLEALADSFGSFTELLDSGAVGLMNVASADGFSRSGTYSTLAAGVKAHGVLGPHTWYRGFPSPDVIVYDFGSVTESEREALYEQSDASFFSTPASVLADLLAQLHRGRLELLIFVSPTSDEVWAPSPVAVCGKGFPGGVLTSGTTHTPGLVAAVDFAPTILHTLGAPIPASMLGLPMLAKASDEPVPLVGRLDRRIRISQKDHFPVPITMGSLIPLGAILGALAVTAKRRRVGLARLSRAALTFGWVLVMFLGFLPSGGTEGPSWASPVIVIVGLWVSLPLLQRWHRSGRDCLVTVFLLAIPVLALVDCALGARLTSASLLSHYALIHGLRYYGIGNQAAGIVLGSLLGGIAVWAYVRRVEQPSKRAIWLFCLWAFALALVFGYPGMGSNMGMYIAAYAMGVALLAAMRGQGLGWVRGAVLIMVGAVVLCSFVAIDAMREPSAQTHLGRAVAQAMETGGASLWAAAARKAAQNFQIMSQPIILSLIVVALAFALLWRLIRPWGADQRRGLGLGRVALWSAAVAFVANDSGVIAASFLMAGYVVGAVEVSMARLIEEAKG